MGVSDSHDSHQHNSFFTPSASCNIFLHRVCASIGTRDAPLTMCHLSKKTVRTKDRNNRILNSIASCCASVQPHLWGAIWLTGGIAQTPVLLRFLTFFMFEIHISSGCQFFLDSNGDQEIINTTLTNRFFLVMTM